MKKFLFIFTNQPYSGTDNAYNALRLARALKEKGEEVRIFLMNGAVDLARNSTKKPENYDVDLVAMLKESYTLVALCLRFVVAAKQGVVCMWESLILRLR